LEELEKRKAQENAQIQAEMERVTAHYAERIQQSQDQVAREKKPCAPGNYRSNSKASGLPKSSNCVQSRLQRL
jgi:hypothetical protein